MPHHSHDCMPGRRDALRRIGGFVAGALVPPAVAQEPLPDILQPARPAPQAFMQRAFEMRRLAIERGDQPYGAVIVNSGRIIGEGVSAVITDNDPGAHAEMQAIRDAQRRSGVFDLSGSQLYGTSRACPICEAGAFRTRIARMFHGEGITDAGAPRLR